MKRTVPTIPGGDRFSVSFEDYRDMDGWKLPYRIKVRVEVVPASATGTVRRVGEMAIPVSSYRLHSVGPG